MEINVKLKRRRMTSFQSMMVKMSQKLFQRGGLQFVVSIEHINIVLTKKPREVKRASIIPCLIR